MARPYRKVAEATERLRKMAGVLAAVNTADDSSAWVAVGALKELVQAALEDLQADRIVEPSTSFTDGWDLMATLTQPLPFPES
jgi:hypothetical protein